MSQEKAIIRPWLSRTVSVPKLRIAPPGSTCGAVEGANTFWMKCSQRTGIQQILCIRAALHLVKDPRVMIFLGFASFILQTRKRTV